LQEGGGLEEGADLGAERRQALGRHLAGRQKASK
jgi:hypothetical protein